MIQQHVYSTFTFIKFLKVCKLFPERDTFCTCWIPVVVTLIHLKVFVVNVLVD